jgi:hypothetical protein
MRLPPRMSGLTGAKGSGGPELLTGRVGIAEVSKPQTLSCHRLVLGWTVLLVDQHEQEINVTDNLSSVHS